MNEDVQIVVLFTVVVCCCCFFCSPSLFLLISAHRWHNTQHNMEIYSARKAAVSIIPLLSPDSCDSIFLNGFVPFHSFKIYADRALSFDASIALKPTEFGEH